MMDFHSIFSAMVKSGATGFTLKQHRTKKTLPWSNNRMIWASVKEQKGRKKKSYGIASKENYEATRKYLIEKISGNPLSLDVISGTFVYDLNRNESYKVQVTIKNFENGEMTTIKFL